jgi:tetratricopeptide (TPR) repeat protein
VHAGTAEIMARVSLLEGGVIEPGAAGWAQLRLASPAALAIGDRFVIRRPSPPETLGGGAVADISGERLRRRREAVAVLERYTSVKPEDTDALRQLANLWGILVSQAQREAEAAQAEAAQVSAAKTFAPPSAKFLQDIEQNKIADQLAAQATTRANAAGARAQAAASSQQKVYGSLTDLIPDDPSLQLSLGIAAQQAGDYQTAVKAYKKFVALAPNDPSVREVKARIKFLESLVQPSG